MRCHKKSLEKRPIAGCIRSHLRAKPRSRPCMGTKFHQICLTADICSGRSKSAASILNERTCRNIRTEFDWFFFTGKFTIAVIYKTNRIRIFALTVSTIFLYPQEIRNREACNHGTAVFPPALHFHPPPRQWHPNHMHSL